MDMMPEPIQVPFSKETAIYQYAIDTSKTKDEIRIQINKTGEKKKLEETKAIACEYKDHIERMKLPEWATKNDQYKATVNVVIPTEICRAICEINGKNNSARYNRGGKTLELHNEDGYLTLANYTRQSWNYFVLINALNTMMISDKISSAQIHGVQPSQPDSIAESWLFSDLKYAPYAEKIARSIQDVENWFNNLDLYNFIKEMKYIIRETLPKRHGITNKLNECYINAVLQMLFSSKRMRALIMKLDKETGSKTAEDLNKIFSELGGTRNPIDILSNKKDLLKSIKFPYELGTQQDALELLESMLTTLLEQATETYDRTKERLKHIKDITETRINVCHNAKVAFSIPGQEYGAILTTTRKCNAEECNKERQTKIIDPIIKMPIEKDTLMGNIDNEFRKWVPLEDYTCSFCKKKTNASQKMEIVPGNTLFIALNRFKWDPDQEQTVKIDKAVECTELELGDKIYRIRAAIEHIGETANRGHYITKICLENGRTVTADDERIYLGAPIDMEKVYILMYERDKKSERERERTKGLLKAVAHGNVGESVSDKPNTGK